MFYQLVVVLVVVSHMQRSTTYILRSAIKIIIGEMYTFMCMLYSLIRTINTNILAATNGPTGQGRQSR